MKITIEWAVQINSGPQYEYYGTKGHWQILNAVTCSMSVSFFKVRLV